LAVDGQENDGRQSADCDRDRGRLRTIRALTHDPGRQQDSHEDLRPPVRRIRRVCDEGETVETLPGCKTAAMILPSGIQAYVAVNSDNNGYSGSIQGVLGSAFDAALR